MRNRRCPKGQGKEGERTLASNPFQEADAATFLGIFGAFVAAFDPGDKPRLAAYLDVLTLVRRALDGERDISDERRH